MVLQWKFLCGLFYIYLCLDSGDESYTVTNADVDFFNDHAEFAASFAGEKLGKKQKSAVSDSEDEIADYEQQPRNKWNLKQVWVYLLSIFCLTFFVKKSLLPTKKGDGSLKFTEPRQEGVVEVSEEEPDEVDDIDPVVTDSDDDMLLEDAPHLPITADERRELIAQCKVKMSEIAEAVLEAPEKHVWSMFPAIFQIFLLFPCFV